MRRKTGNVGSGDRQPTEPLKAAASEQPEETEEEPVEEAEEVEAEEEAQPEEAVEEEVLAEESEPTDAASSAEAEELLTQQNEEALAIKKAEEEKQRQAELDRQKKAEIERQRQAEAERKRQAEAERKRKAAEEAERKRKAAEEAERKRREEEERKKAAARKNADALFGAIDDQSGKAEGGEGNDNQAGDKGVKTGDPNASGYYGLGGSGSGGNYRLGNRNALSRPKPDYPCNEQGKVVVEITVDQQGRVIAANPGIKGTTNSASCLLEEAKKAAMKTRFNADAKAPERQKGQIIYNFSLSD